MRAFILDNGLTGLGAHNFAVDMAVQQAFVAKNIPCKVYSAQAAPSETLRPLNAVPHFTRYFYEGTRVPSLGQLPGFIWHKLTRHPGQPACKDALSERITHRRLNRAYRRDLARLPQVWQRGDLVVIPAISQNQLLGLCEYLVGLPADSRPAVICQLMFQPEWTPWGAPALHGARFYWRAFARAKPLIGRNLFFIAETQSMADEYRQRFSIPVIALPLPIELNDFACAKPLPHSPPLLAYLGYAKTERGFHLLPDAIAALTSRNIPARFLIQVHHSGWEREVIDAARALERFSNIEITKGALSREDYLNCLRRAGGILLPYDSQKYCQRGSAVLLEAVAARRPVVVSDHGWPAQLMRAHDAAGTIMRSFDSASLALAIENLLNDFPKYTEAARALAPSMVERHRPEHFVEALLNIAQQTSIALASAHNRFYP